MKKEKTKPFIPKVGGKDITLHIPLDVEPETLEFINKILLEKRFNKVVMELIKNHDRLKPEGNYLTREEAIKLFEDMCSKCSRRNEMPVVECSNAKRKLADLELE
ncbi:MAG: hypothetical protein SFH39_00245 [Candidatus Magnetobacterium sp. LHC-1]